MSKTSMESTRGLYRLLERTPRSPRCYSVVRPAPSRSAAARWSSTLINALRATIVMWMETGTRGHPTEIGRPVADLFKHGRGED